MILNFLKNFGFREKMIGTPLSAKIMAKIKNFENPNLFSFPVSIFICDNFGTKIFKIGPQLAEKIEF